MFDRLQALTESELDRQRPLIESRAARGVPCDTHGDLRLGHVYLLGERKPPGDLVVIDCIEFNDEYRFADPVADMAFLVMGFKQQRRNDLARAFADSYFARPATTKDAGCCRCTPHTARRSAPKWTASR